MLLVTGITGHSGRFFLQQLNAGKFKGLIRCIVRETSDTSFIDNSDLDIEKVVGNLEDQAFMDKVMCNVDTVMHIASIFYSVTLINAAVKNNVRRIILVHTTGIYSKHKSASEEYKSIENKINSIISQSESKIGLIYLRPTMIYGNIHDRNMVVFIRMIDKMRLFPIVAQGANKVQPVNGKDLGIAYYQVLMKAEIMNGDYILSGEKPISMKQLFVLISEQLGKKTIFVSVPLQFSVGIAKLLKIISLKKLDFIEKVQRMGEDRSFPHNEANKDFGFKPMPLAEGLKAEIEEYVKMLR